MSAYYDASLITGFGNYFEEKSVTTYNPILYFGDCISFKMRGAYLCIATINESCVFETIKINDLVLRINDNSINNTTSYAHCAYLLNEETIVMECFSYRSIERNTYTQSVMHFKIYN